jgi:hypothetical protein
MNELHKRSKRPARSNRSLNKHRQKNIEVTQQQAQTQKNIEVTQERFDKEGMSLLIIRLFQLVFSVETVFFSHSKSANSVFQPAYQPNRTGPECAANHRKREQAGEAPAVSKKRESPGVNSRTPRLGARVFRIRTRGLFTCAYYISIKHTRKPAT